jgi:lysophospholipase L1-like esterase
MISVKSCALVIAFAVTVGFGAACSKSPTAPTPPPPPPPPPVANPPSLACVEGVSRSTVNAGGLAVSYDTPPVTDGQGSVTVTCSPSSGETFPIGTTAVTCTATDTLNRTGSCSFNVTVSKLAQLSRVKFLAFGDSITAGEVTAPVGGSIFTGLGAIHRQVIVPTAAYPAVLARTLQGRYSSQANLISVANDSVGGEKVIVARNRYFQALNVVRPEAVLILMGYNDIARGEDGAASGAASEIRVWAAEARNRGMRVFIATPTPGLAGHGRVIDPFLLVDYANRMRDIAVRDNHVLVELYNTMLPDAQRYIGIDGLHPNEAGYAKIADLFFQAIQTNLEVR